MSDEMKDAIREQAAAIKQTAMINAAAVAQRQRDDESRKTESAVGWDANYRIQALAQSTALHRNKPEATADAIITDADRFLAWLKGEISS